MKGCCTLKIRQRNLKYLELKKGKTKPISMFSYHKYNTKLISHEEIYFIFYFLN
jgi:hypothetical protein